MTDIFNERRRGLEEEYIHRKDKEALEKLRAALREAAHAKGEEAATMQCPRCAGKLHEVAAEGIHIDRCDTCHGVWLDAGELDHLVSTGDRESARGHWLRAFWPRTSDE